MISLILSRIGSGVCDLLTKYERCILATMPISSLQLKIQWPRGITHPVGEPGSFQKMVQRLQCEALSYFLSTEKLQLSIKRNPCDRIVVMISSRDCINPHRTNGHGASVTICSMFLFIPTERHFGSKKTYIYTVGKGWKGYKVVHAQRPPLKNVNKAVVGNNSYIFDKKEFKHNYLA